MKKILLILVTFFTVLNVKAVSFNLNSKYAIVYNVTENRIMYEKDSKEEAKVASMTKIMTAILVIENNKDLDKEITIKDEDLRDMYEYTTTGFQDGDKVTIRELLYGILLKSGSDAVNAAVRITTDDEEAFINLMNQKAKELNLTNTHFSNPIGKDDGNYSSVYDIAKIMEYCLKNKEFKEIISTNMYYIDDLDLQINGPLYKMDTKYNLDLSMIKGSKSGFTSLAKHSLVSYGENDGVTLIVVTNAADNFNNLLIDNTQIYNYYFNNYEYKDYNINFDIDIEDGKEEKYSVNINTKVYLKNDYDKSLLSYKYNGVNKITFLNNKGSKLGKLSIYYDKVLVKEIDVRLDEDIKYKASAYRLPFIIIILTIVLFLVLIIKKKLKKIKRKIKKIIKATNTYKKEIKKVNYVQKNVENFIKEENSEERKLNILKNTLNINLFFNTLKSVNYTSKDKEVFEKNFIDRCFQNINFNSVEELKDLYTKLKLFKKEMSSNTIKYYNRLFKYCIDEYIEKK